MSKTIGNRKSQRLVKVGGDGLREENTLETLDSNEGPSGRNAETCLSREASHVMKPQGMTTPPTAELAAKRIERH
ncbi:hypothetical protein PV327_001341 [Microctonus hyperodae]|uniref:Uncharacterized protein n=1 Tax=Microctonus hyperodae TaxID=165561 RepID=A0AA39G977_MICHY|nr:hypothetical protein PV327_001341 [Microctonus hyperodae]